MINNNGVFKPQQGLAQVDRSAYVNVSLSLRTGKIESATDWVTDRALPVDNLTVQVAPGGVAVVALTVRP